ncbi:MAG: hypothetical protein LBT64_00260 [Puniceicoccales bacterium]|jgi:hypothetical protein|nr:hypothetical protein [Puniceicoccales bacterium]
MENFTKSDEGGKQSQKLKKIDGQLRKLRKFENAAENEKLCCVFWICNMIGYASIFVEIREKR